MPANIQSAYETATWLQLLLWSTLAVAALWLALLIFIAWRRSSTNLTPVTAPAVNRKAQPGFLTVDREAHRAALGRADAFEKKLSDQERREARAKIKRARAGQAKGPLRIAGLASLFMSVFSLATLISGAVWQVTWIGTVWNTYSAWERIGEVIRTHPAAFAVCAIVILYHIGSFFAKRKWREAV